MPNFDLPSESPSNEDGEEKKHDKEPDTMDDLLDNLSKLDKDDPDFETKKAELLDKMKEIKETSGESPDNTESVGVEEFLKDKNIETEDAEKTRKQLEATRKAIADMPNPDDPIAKEMTRVLKKREQELLGKQAKENPDGDVWKDLR